MKKSVIFLICLMFSFLAFSQNEMKNVKVNAEVEVNPPQFTGVKKVAVLPQDDKTLLIEKYLLENSYYPESKAKCLREGTEVVQFTITTTGEVTNFKIINSVCDLIDKEIVRVLKTTNGMWTPGFNDGEPFEMEREVSMVYKLEDYDNTVKHFMDKATKLCIRGNKNLFLKENPQKALKCYNEGIRYLPYDKGLLYLRGICLHELGDKEAARNDWNRIASLGGLSSYDTVDFDINSQNMKGFAEANKILNK